MKSVIKGLLLGLGLSSSLVNADFLGDADDSYIGFRMTTSLAASAVWTGPPVATMATSLPSRIVTASPARNGVS